LNASLAAIPDYSGENSRTKNAIRKRIRSKTMTVSIPHRPMLAVVMMGIRIEFREQEKASKQTNFLIELSEE